MGLTLSIALVTFNRDRFLVQQLESIAAQSRLPDELIIGDDCSTDGTADIIRDFAEHAPFPVRWYVNKRNIGYDRNLEYAIQLCSGDVIVFCDDDDVSLAEKLRVTEDEFRKSPAIGLMVNNSALVDNKLRPLGITLWDTARLAVRKAGAVSKDPICTLARHFISAGHVLAFRASLRPYILPFPREFPPRIFCDVWIALVLASITTLACVPEPLVLHRLHGGQIAGVHSPVSLRERIARDRSREREKTGQFVSLVEEAICRVSTLTDASPAGQNLEKLIRWAEHMKMYLELPARRHRRLVPIARALLVGQYHRYSRGFLTAARDLVLQ